MAKKPGNDWDILAGIGLAFGLGALAIAVLSPEKKQPAPPPPQPNGPSADVVMTVARHHLQYICRELGVPMIPLGIAPRADNAYSDGTSVWIDPEWVGSLIGSFCDTSRLCLNAIILGVMGHEVGHHVHRDIFATDQSVPARYARELAADRTAGFLLGRARIPADDFARVLDTLSSRGSATHPPGEARRVAIQEGYHLGLQPVGSA
jgi:hypothetical protein